MAVSGVHQVVFAFREHGEDMEREIISELDRLAEGAALTMQRLAPKSQSTLRNSIYVIANDKMTREIGADVNYAEAVEKGVKPGGKGLPRFFDPKSKSIVDWLESRPSSRFMGPHLQGKKHKAKNGSPALQREEKALRNRYFGLYLHVRRFGIKAQPFVEPTARAMEPIVLNSLDLAVRRVLAARPDAGAVA